MSSGKSPPPSARVPEMNDTALSTSRVNGSDRVTNSSPRSR
jgi:hypothetical protein